MKDDFASVFKFGAIVTMIISIAGVAGAVYVVSLIIDALQKYIGG